MAVIAALQAEGEFPHDPITVGDTSTLDLTLVGQLLTGAVVPGGISHTDIIDIGATSHEDIDDFIASSYSAAVVDGLIAAEVAAINHRVESWPMLAAQIYNTYTHGLGRAGTISTAALTADAIYFTPIYIPETKTFDRIGINVAVDVVASTCRLGVFTLNLTTGTATLVLDAGTVDTSSIGNKEATISQSLTAGWYWLAMQPTHAISVQGATPSFGYSYSISSSALLATRVQTGGASGAFSATEATNTSSATAHSTYLRVS